ncbi:MAG: phosphate ABC transporter permease, partial [Synechococcus sp.]|nr:phosphate ABC transporter permease [Synechococcus sp.]
LQLMFLLSPILYKRDFLGSHSWVADFNPLYRVLSVLRHALIHGELKVGQTVVILIANLLGAYCAIGLLQRQRQQLPFWV